MIRRPPKYTLTVTRFPDTRLFRSEMRRICRPGALLSMIIDYEDQYDQRGGGTSVYNFLRFSETEWKRFNPDLHYQNRLRHSDHLRIFEDAGFAIVEVETAFTEDWEKIFPVEELAPEFMGFELYDLTIQHGDRTCVVSGKSVRSGVDL